MDNKSLLEALKNELPFITKLENRLLTKQQLQCLKTLHLFYQENRIPLDKKKLRKQFLQQRNLLSKLEIEEYSLRFSNLFLESEEYQKSTSLFLYLSFGKELNTEYILKQALSDKKSVYVPVIYGREMRLCEITESTVYRNNRLGIREPLTEKPNETVTPPDLTLVPALAFNSLGFRIGYGGGYYDKYLADYKGISIGFGMPGFLTEQFLPNDYDVPVDRLLLIE